MNETKWKNLQRFMFGKKKGMLFKIMVHGSAYTII